MLLQFLFAVSFFFLSLRFREAALMAFGMTEEEEEEEEEEEPAKMW